MTWLVAEERPACGRELKGQRTVEVGGGATPEQWQYEVTGASRILNA